MCERTKVDVHSLDEVDVKLGCMRSCMVHVQNSPSVPLVRPLSLDNLKNGLQGFHEVACTDSVVLRDIVHIDDTLGEQGGGDHHLLCAASPLGLYGRPFLSDYFDCSLVLGEERDIKVFSVVFIVSG